MADNEREPDLQPLRNRDHASFQQLVLQYHKHMLIVARAIVGESIAEEVVQEAWISVYNALPSFEGRSTLKTWIYRIVSNQAKSRLRKESRYTHPVNMNDDTPAYLSVTHFDANGHWSIPPPQWEDETPQNLAENEQLMECIEKTLENLSDQQKSVFILRDIDQQSLDDICNILDLSASNVRVLLHRARVKLMQVIDHYQTTGTC